MAEPYATAQDIATLWRPLTAEETSRANALLPIVSDSLRQEAHFVGRDLDAMIAGGEVYSNVVKDVVVDVVARALMTSTDSEPMTQMTQSALGYSVSGTYLVPGGGLFIKRSELARLGLRRQKIGALQIYGRN